MEILVYQVAAVSSNMDKVYNSNELAYKYLLTFVNNYTVHLYYEN